jgi:hypothetical protein
MHAGSNAPDELPGIGLLGGGYGSFPQFPHLDKKTGDPLQALGEMFSSSVVRVTQDSNGNVRMVDPGVPADFLNIRIHRITFKDHWGNDIFTANDALSFILGALEVVAFFRGHDIEVVPPMWILNRTLGASGPPGSPHMSGTLDNVTVGEALDRILQSFRGLLFYENCPQSETHKRAVFLQFFRLKKRNLGSGGM